MKLWVPVIKVRIKQVDLGKATFMPNAGGRNLFKPQFILLAIVAAGLAGMFLIWHNLNSPGYGQVSTPTQDSPHGPRLPDYTTLTTNYYSLNYSERYTQQPADIPPAGILDQKILSGQAGAGTIEVDVKAAPVGGITQDSTYIYYQKKPDQYRLTNKLYRDEIVNIARSTKGSPQAAALWLHGSFLMIIRITTADKNQNIDNELKDILSSVQWSSS